MENSVETRMELSKPILNINLKKIGTDTNCSHWNTCILYKNLNEDHKTLISKIFSSEMIDGPDQTQGLLHDIVKKLHSGKCKKETEILDKVLEIFPKLVTLKSNKRGFEGQTPLHIAICKGNVTVVEKMIKTAKAVKDDSWSESKATGKKFKRSAMLGQLPLSIAALTFNTRMFEVLHNAGAEIKEVNEKGDNVLHSLIKYSHLYPAKRTYVVSMISAILKAFDDETIKTLCKKQRNNKLFLPLELATLLGEHEIFRKMINHRIYCDVNVDEGMYDIKVYDVEDIDTVTDEHNQPKSTQNDNCKETNKKCSHLSQKAKEVKNWIKTTLRISDNKKREQRNILMLLHDLEPEMAFCIAGEKPVCRIIYKKWNKSLYWWIFYIWWFLHTAFIVGLTYVSVKRSFQNNGTSIEEPPSFKHVMFHDTYVTVYGFLGAVVGSVYLVMEIMRMIKGTLHWTKKSFGNPYGNGWFRLFLVLMAWCLIIDVFLASLVDTYENNLLVCSVVIGWFLQLFFLRSWRRFSYFTVLIAKIVVKDMLPFFVVLFVEVVAFSTAMYMTIQGSEIELEEDYLTFWRVLFTMAKLMVGLGDPESFYKLRQPPLGIIIFIAFVIMTTLLIFYALIAVMGETCTDLLGSGNGKRRHQNHWILQRLSLILFIESFLPDYFHYRVGKPSKVAPAEHLEGRRTITIKSKRATGSREADEEADENEEDDKVDGTFDFDYEEINGVIRNENHLYETISPSMCKHDKCELDIYYIRPEIASFLHSCKVENS